MIVMGIDQSFTSSGIVILNEEGNVNLFKTINTGPEQGNIFDRSLLIADEITLLIVNYNIEKVILEGLAFGLSHSTSLTDLAALQGIIIYSLLLMEMDNYKIITPGTLKKYATGNGRASKKEVFEGLPEIVRDAIIEIGYKPTTGMYDIADAYWLAKMGQDKKFESYMTNL